MGKSMLKKIMIVLVLLLLSVGAGWFGYMWLSPEKPVQRVYPKAPLTAVIDWELVKPFELQIYYTIDQNESFSYKHSIKKKVTPEDKHVKVVIPEPKIYKFRIDFGSNPEKVVVKNVEIIADQYINFNDWRNYVYRNIEKSKINKDDNTLTVTSTHRDPYMFWNIPFVLYKNE